MKPSELLLKADKEAIEIISALYDERDRLRAEIERLKTENEALNNRFVSKTEYDALKAEIEIYKKINATQKVFLEAAEKYESRLKQALAVAKEGLNSYADKVGLGGPALRTLAEIEKLDQSSIKKRYIR